MIRRAVAPGLAAAALLSGCRAPVEGWNKTAFWGNEALDHLVLTPAAGVYEGLTPKPLRDGISNFFANLGEIDTILNDLLQGKWEQGGRDLARFATNTTIGLAGFLDVASRFGLERHQEDFGQTLAVWGVPQGRYLVLPVLGPTTARDVWGIPVSFATNPVSFTGSTVATLHAVHAVDRRLQAEPALRAREEAALDPYEFTKAAWLRHRERLVHDGDPPEEDVRHELEALLEEASER